MYKANNGRPNKTLPMVRKYIVSTTLFIGEFKDYIILNILLK